MKKRIVRIIANVILLTAKSTVNSASAWYGYQPMKPERLNKRGCDTQNNCKTSL